MLTLLIKVLQHIVKKCNNTRSVSEFEVIKATGLDSFRWQKISFEAMKCTLVNNPQLTSISFRRKHRASEALHGRPVSGLALR